MQIVIDINDNVYKRLVAGEVKYGGITARNIFNSVKDGTPLPKVHGDLIDRDMLPADYITDDDIDNAPVIVEANY